MLDILRWMLIGLLAGWVAGVITRPDRNVWGDLALGLIAATMAGFAVDRSVGGDTGFWTSLIAATVAAVSVVMIKNAILGGGD